MYNANLRLSSPAAPFEADLSSVHDYSPTEREKITLEKVMDVGDKIKIKN